MLCTCQAGFEDLLAQELEAAGAAVLERGSAWVLAGDSAGLPDLVFAHLILREPVELKGESVNSLAQKILEFFTSGIRGERLEGNWPNCWLYPPETVGLGRRTSAVAGAFDQLLRKKLSRVAKLAAPEIPRRPGPARGLFVWFADFGRIWVARDAHVNGPRRMADDPQAPSRSYLKVEEAFALLGREPAPGEWVADLGAAPGGWSYSSAKRGARVVAVDNGPLKGGALNHPLIEHRHEDAFRFHPRPDEHFDWLLCDLVEEPHHVLQQIIDPWLNRRWCGQFVLNLKFGRVDGLALIRELRAPDSILSTAAEDVCIRHLFHDREELTVVGRVRHV
jgi:23S rRNA (cytidine2498-2'-O)-methyltransferase